MSSQEFPAAMMQVFPVGDVIRIVQVPAFEV
jgi:hypothetical protein